jgi:hypothetical protein
MVNADYKFLFFLLIFQYLSSVKMSDMTINGGVKSNADYKYLFFVIITVSRFKISDLTINGRVRSNADYEYLFFQYPALRSPT